MAMRVFHRRQHSSSTLLWASIPLFSIDRTYSFICPSPLHNVDAKNQNLCRAFNQDVMTNLLTIVASKPTLSLKRSRSSYAFASASALQLTRHLSHAISFHQSFSRPFSTHQPQHQSTSTRLFGSNPATSNEPGKINLSDDRYDPQTIPIDLPALHKTIDAIRDILGYPTYDVSLSLIDEDYMKEVNSETRGVDSSTDVLSFSFTECVEPGILEEVPPYGAFIGDMYCLGDLLICVDYVAKRCEEDQKKDERSGPEKDAEMIEGEVLADDAASAVDTGNTDDDDDEYEYRDIEVEVLDEWDDRGVAPALLTTFDPQIRIHMLIVHGMLHLVGYDHIEDDDYELMVEKEDEVMAELKKRLGDDFGLERRALTAADAD